MSKTFHRILIFEESSKHGNQKYLITAIEMTIIGHKNQEYHGSCLERFKFKLRQNQRVCMPKWKIGVARSGS